MALGKTVEIEIGNINELYEIERKKENILKAKK